MSKTTSYADLGKDGSDLLGKGFPVSGAKKNNWEGGLATKVLHEASLHGFLLKSSVLNGPAGVNFTFEPEYKWTVGSNPLQFKGKFDSATNLVEGSVAVSDLGSAGTEFKPWFKRLTAKEGKVTTAGLQLGFVNDKVNFSLKTDSPSDFSTHKLDTNLVVQFPANLFWGVNFVYTQPKAAAKAEKKDDKAEEAKKDEESPYDVNVKLQYAQQDSSFVAALETNPKAKSKELTFTWLQTVSAILKVATRFVLPAVGDAAPTAIVGAEHKWDEKTTVKSKLSVSAESRLNVAYTQSVNSYTTVTVGADINANKLVGDGKGDDHSFGVEIKLK